MSYEALIFDFDGVLIDSGFDGFHWALEAREEFAHERDLDIDMNILGQGLYVRRETVITDIIERQNITWNQFRNMEKAVAERKVELASTGELELFDDVRPVLDQLDIPIAIVSNSYRDYLQAMLVELGIAQYIRFYNAPSIRNIRNFRERMKPEPVMINEALERLGTDNVVMIGDQLEDVMGAKRAGIDSIYIDRNGGIEEEANYSVESLKEALELINP